MAARALWSGRANQTRHLPARRRANPPGKRRARDSGLPQRRVCKQAFPVGNQATVRPRRSAERAMILAVPGVLGVYRCRERGPVG